MSSSLSSLSTRVPSIFSFAASYPSEDGTSLHEIPFDDNYRQEPRGFQPDHKKEQESYASQPAPKRRRVNGRPKNQWTSSRRRKLSRLYLMTELNAADIGRVLEATNFSPRKRDVQKQVKALLQPHPDKVKMKSHCSRTRLYQLQKCRSLQTENPANNAGCPSLEDGLLLGVFDQFRGCDHYNIDGFEEENLWLDEVPTCQTSKNCPYGLSSEEFRGDFDDPPETQIPGSSSLLELNDCPRMIESSFHTRANEVTVSTDIWPGSKCNLDLPEFGPNVLMGGSATPLPRTSSLLRRVQIPVTGKKLPSEYVDKSAPTNGLLSSPVTLDSNFDNSHTNCSSRVAVDSKYLGKEADSESISSVSGSSSRSAVLGFKHLRKRLSSKYNEAHVQDVLSVLEHLTLSGSSEASSSRGERRSSKISTDSSGIASDLAPKLLPGNVSQSAPLRLLDILKGASPGYCWEQINSRTLHRIGTLLNPRAPIHLHSGTRLSTAIRANIFGSIIGNTQRMAEVNEKDAFGNSILHIAAALSANSVDLVTLIELGADVTAFNNAGQTFLHLIPEKRLENRKDVYLLLRTACAYGLDFSQRDHLGQSILHLWTRTWLPYETLGGIIESLNDLAIDPQGSRDSLGWTVVEQLNHFATRSLDGDSARAVLGLLGDKVGRITNQGKPGNVSSNYFANTASIKTLAQLEQYTYHADLLRTINKATSYPWFEDSNGRNGLHSLAEVSLKLHCPYTSLLNNKSAGTFPPRERYLIELLQVGVDSKNYDKEGQTPLMAFITHMQPEDDDECTSRVLDRLIKASNSLQWRNRQGETALHIAVKLGRRVATKLLLSHKANVHARTSTGIGVLVVGQEHSRKAKKDDYLYAQIMLCMSLSIDAGAVSAPTAFQEWSWA